ncbi:immunoglobulin-like domain-containing protein [Salinicoccus sp. HZC-1]|uniref:immunoglobulin-like domain-containing protein n=1 Tax=Salinicoccus sp. HZC-1 TaxID=3385497 RepID=UPI00398A9D3E
MKKVMLFLVTVIMISVSACQPEMEMTTLPEPVPYQNLSPSSHDLSISLEETDFSGPPEILNITLKNSGDKLYHYGMFYQLEYKIDGMWYIIPYNDNIFAKYPDFRNTGRMIKPQATVLQTYTPDELDLHLSAGEYRLVKTFIYADSSYTVTIAAPFQIY